MMRSLYSGVAGLKTHQTKMDVIGNNIANVNTTAYKSSSIVFQDLMSQTTQAASGPNAATGTGGINARQIGLGVKSGAINMNISGQGSAQSTGNPFDIMITGDNFFVVNNGNGNYFTRDGSFYVDGAGNLAMTSTGYNVMGWQVDPENESQVKQDTVSALRIMSSENMTYRAEYTQAATVDGIVDKFDTDYTSSSGKSINLNFFDNLGYSYTARLTFRQSELDGNNKGTKYSVEFSKLLDSNGNEVDLNGATLGSTTIQSISMTKGLTEGYTWDTTNGTLKDVNGNVVYDGTAITDFTTDAAKKTVEDLAKAYNMTADEFLNYGVYVKSGDTASVTTVKDMLGNASNADGGFYSTMVKATDNTKTPPVEYAKSSVDFTGRKFTGAVLEFNPDNGKFVGIGGPGNDTIKLELAGALGNNFHDIEIDFSGTALSNNNGTSTIEATSGDKQGLFSGRKLGDMIGVSIQNNGMIYASYDNGMTRLLGQIATASFANASGLQKEGDNLYSSTMNSGEFDGIGVDVTANGSYMSTGQLEMSNVDLSTEFTSMITTQRGFQANSRIITVSDTLLEELTNLKR
ncbi:MAG: flagellar hook-basal body complex protein [Lachnospiraceae bacterium]|nr:flagellar hook-basal body complex protein [Lachnospiraceae bacterium]